MIGENKYAIGKLSDEFVNMGKIKDVIVDTAIGEIAIGHDNVFVGLIEGRTKRLSKFKDIDASNELRKEDIEDLTNKIEQSIRAS